MKCVYLASKNCCGSELMNFVPRLSLLPRSYFLDATSAKFTPKPISSYSDEDIMNFNESEISNFEGQNDSETQPKGTTTHDGIGPFNDVNLPGVWFYKMPHKVWDTFCFGH